MATKVVMPQLGESVVDGTVIKWLRKEGEPIEEFESLLEVESAKVSTEIPSPADGVVLKILVGEGETVDAGTVIAWIGDVGETVEDTVASAAKKTDEEPEAAVSYEAAAEKKEIEKPQRSFGFISPVVARLSREHGVDLSLIRGTGINGRITKKDVMQYLENQAASTDEPELAAWETPGEGDLFRPTELQFPDRFKQEKPVAQSAPPVSRKPVPSAKAGELIPHSSMRRSIAAHMVESISTSVHVTTVMEADLFNIVNHREKNKANFAAQGVNLTFTAYFMMAVAKALRKYPQVNSSWQDEGLYLHQDVNIGMAAALDDGLIVPVIRNADEFSLMGMAKRVNDFANRAKNKQLQPDEVSGGTFTITNHGTSGSLFATPIINQPQCGILGVGAIKKRAVVINDAIAIRPMVYLSFTFDHRILDGASADAFLADVVLQLENWEKEA